MLVLCNRLYITTSCHPFRVISLLTRRANGLWTLAATASEMKKLAETRPLHPRNTTGYHMQPVVQSFEPGNAKPEWRQSAQGSQVRVRYQPMVEIFGDQWSLLVIRDIIFMNRRHFRELLTKSVEGIASNILADRLQRLVEQGIIVKSQDPSHKQKAIYSLTERGIELLPLLMEMAAWGQQVFAGLQAEGSGSGPGRRRTEAEGRIYG